MEVERRSEGVWEYDGFNFGGMAFYYYRFPLKLTLLLLEALKTGSEEPIKKYARVSKARMEVGLRAYRFYERALRDERVGSILIWRNPCYGCDFRDVYHFTEVNGKIIHVLGYIALEPRAGFLLGEALWGYRIVREAVLPDIVGEPSFQRVKGVPKTPLDIAREAAPAEAYRRIAGGARWTLVGPLWLVETGEPGRAGERLADRVYHLGFYDIYARDSYISRWQSRISAYTPIYVLDPEIEFNLYGARRVRRLEGWWGIYGRRMSLGVKRWERGES